VDGRQRTPSGGDERPFVTVASVVTVACVDLRYELDYHGVMSTSALTHRSSLRDAHATQGPDQSTVTIWPNLRVVAQLLKVDPSMLSKYGSNLRGRPLAIVPCGQERRYSPTAVLTLADHYKRRPITSVASDLVSHAEAVAEDAEELETLEMDVQRYLEATRGATQVEGDDDWLKEAARRFPAHIVNVIKGVIADHERSVSSHR